MKLFILGAMTSLVTAVVVGLIWLSLGGMPVATSGRPLPFEKMIAGMAIHAAIGSAENTPSPVPADDENLLAGAKVYKTNCAVCHGLLKTQPSAIAVGLFPPPPELLPPHKGVTDDAVGETFWKVKHGIRLTGMPGFEKSLSDKEMWQVSELLLSADKLPTTVTKELEGP